jgi:hypothetical protein
MTELSPRDRDRVAQLESLVNRMRHLNALVEQFAGAPRDADQLAGTLRRSLGQLKQQFTTAGFDRLALMCGGLEMTARRGMSHGPKARALREGVGTLSRQMEIEKRGILSSVPRTDKDPR